ncbi:MAG: FprA family A-type flavoprotein [Clostridiales bacterium]|nr:FprA family A-type flavoprotein [Clostridiales bacterium]
MLELKPSIYYCGAQNPDLRVFDIIMKTPLGTSYNAFLIKGEKKTALVETVKSGFWDVYAQRINAVMPISEVDYLIMNHTEPDHAGSILELLKVNPNVTIVGTSSAIMFISHIINAPFNSLVVKKGDSIDLGDRTLAFYPMPNLHWPDTMFTFDDKSRALFCCDCFGAHFSYAPVLLSLMENKDEYYRAQEQYFLDIMSPFIDPYVINGTKAARELDPSIICTGHGPVIDIDIPETLGRYEALCTPEKKAKPSVAIAYVSAYGYTKMLAETIAATLQKNNEFNVLIHEVTDDNRRQVMDGIVSSDGFLLGTPTILADALQPIAEVAAALHPILVKGKAASAFGSYGWSGEGVPNMMERLKQLKVETIDGLRVRFRPSGEELLLAEKFAEDFAALIRK